MSDQSAFVRVGARQIHYECVGSGPPLLLLHGGGPGASGASNYVRNIEALSADFRVIVPDLPGYGRSTKGVSRSDPFGDHAGAMFGLMDALKIDRAHLVGNSLGGACALRMTLDQPERVGGVVLMGPGGVDTTRSLPTPGLRALLSYYDGPSLSRLKAFITQYLVYDASDVSDALLQERYEASVDPEVVASPPLLRPKGFKLRDIDFTRDPRLARITTPILVLWGRDDKVNRPSGGASLIKRIASADLHLFARTGHWVQWERAQQFNVIVGSFLAPISISSTRP